MFLLCLVLFNKSFLFNKSNRLFYIANYSMNYMPEENLSETTPFGDYLNRKIQETNSEILKSLLTSYNHFSNASDIESFKRYALELSNKIDTNLNAIKTALGGSVTPFSTFRGFFLEEFAIRVTNLCIGNYNQEGIVVTKLGTGTGIITGALIKYRTGILPETITLEPQRDREDVVLGFKRKVVVHGDGGTQAEFNSEIIPICIIACKMYIDATRLENVLSKAKSFNGLHAKSPFIVLAEWDALGEKWHDEHGIVLDSLYSPVEDIIFLRDGKRPQNQSLERESTNRRYRAESIDLLIKAIKKAIDSWDIRPH